MAKILHFMSDEPMPKNGEYIVIVDGVVEPEEFLKDGFHLDDTYDLEDYGSLPLETSLYAN